MMKSWLALLLSGLVLSGSIPMAAAQTASAPTSQTVTCDIFIAGGGFGGVAAAYESLKLGHTVCMTEITDWIGGQVSAQGVSALDERPLQRENDIFPAAYSEFRRRVTAANNGDRNPGKCWVSVMCFSPQVGHQVLQEMLQPYQDSGKLHLFTETVVKDLRVQGSQIQQIQAIRTIPKRSPLQADQRGNLSEYFLEWYNPNPSADWDKELITFVPPAEREDEALPWMVIDATETGELLPLARVPYRLGTDVATRWEPEAQPETDPYCTQGFTYTFVMERTDLPQIPVKPAFYDEAEHGRYYSYEKARFNFPMIFTYRRIKGQAWGMDEKAIRVGDQSMQNWTWGNDWRISTADTNLILTQNQLEQSGQLQPGGWQGGLRVETLKQGEQHAEGFFYWLVAGTTDFVLQQEDPNFEKDYYFRYRFLQGAETPMGTATGLSKYPYIRESRRIIGRPSVAYPDGFTIYESDITRKESSVQRGRPYVFFDSVGVGQYPIDFHDCLLPDFSRNPLDNHDAQSPSYPFQIPLRALIPQRIDNLLMGAKNIAASRIASAAYRVHPIEWAIGTASAHVAHFSLSQDVIPARIPTVEDMTLLQALQSQIQAANNPIQFPGTTILDTKWADFK